MGKKKGSPKEKRTALINNAEKEDSPQTFGMSKKGQTALSENYCINICKPRWLRVERQTSLLGKPPATV